MTPIRGAGGRRLVALALVLISLATFGAACGRRDGGNDPAPKGFAPDDDALRGKLTVLAASSLTEAFTELGHRFETAHPKVEVAFSFGASSALAQQLIEGAPADVVATADEATMAKVTAAGRAADPVVVARNRLSLLVERGNPKGIRGLADLAEPGVVLVLCAPEVPCGRFAAAALAKAGVAAKPASLEENVKGVVAKVTLGEADAGIVYATDVDAAGDAAEGVAIDGADDPALTAAYPLAAVKDATNPTAARAWIELVRSAEGRQVLSSFGFLGP